MTVSCEGVSRQARRSALMVTPRLVIMSQLSATLAVFFFALLFGSSQWAWSACCGGLAVLIPNALFALIFLCRSRSRSGQFILASFYFGECFKLLSMVSLAVFFFSYFSLDLLALLLGVAVVSVSLLLVPLFTLSKLRQS